MPETLQPYFDALQSYSDLENLIAEGDSEGLYLECKAPIQPLLTKDLKATLAKALSGFSNTAGGTIIWGVSTTKHAHSGVDILTQIEPIGNCKQFQQHLQKTIPTLTTPPLSNITSKILKQNPSDTRGVIVTYIPQTLGDPIQANSDAVFYYRSGDEFITAPYEIVKRLFAATSIPDLHLVFDNKLVQTLPNGGWQIPFAITNASSAIAEHTALTLDFLNPSVCESIEPQILHDVSHVNPGHRLFIIQRDAAVHRGLDVVLGSVKVKMKTNVRAHRLLKLKVELFANKMRARVINITIQLARKGVSIKSLKESYLY